MGDGNGGDNAARAVADGFGDRRQAFGDFPEFTGEPLPSRGSQLLQKLGVRRRALACPEDKSVVRREEGLELVLFKARENDWPDAVRCAGSRTFFAVTSAGRDGEVSSWM